MKYTCHDGVERKVFIEVIKDGVGDCVLMSDIEEATAEEILQLKKEGCAHHSPNHRRQLIFDIPGYMYDIRYCAICGAYLGAV